MVLLILLLWYCGLVDPYSVVVWFHLSIFGGLIQFLFWWSCGSADLLVWSCGSSDPMDLWFCWSLFDGPVVPLILLWWSWPSFSGPMLPWILLGDAVVPMTLPCWSCGSAEHSWVILWFHWSFFWFHWASLCINKTQCPISFHHEIL